MRDDPSCDCGAEVENDDHYFRGCPVYSTQRLKLTTSPLAIYFSIDIIRNGIPTLMGQDKQLFNELLQNYVIETGRFK